MAAENESTVDVAELLTNGYCVVRKNMSVAAAMQKLLRASHGLLDASDIELAPFELYAKGVDRGYFPPKDRKGGCGVLHDGVVSLDHLKRSWYFKRSDNAFPPFASGFENVFGSCYEALDRYANELLKDVADAVAREPGVAPEAAARIERMLTNSERCISTQTHGHALVMLHYPGVSSRCVDGDHEPPENRAREEVHRSDTHADHSLISLVPLIDDGWLEIERSGGALEKIACAANAFVVFVGELLEVLLKGLEYRGAAVTAARHRVVATREQAARQRVSLAFFATMGDRVAFELASTGQPLHWRPNGFPENFKVPSDGLGLSFMVQKPIWREGITFHTFRDSRRRYRDYAAAAVEDYYAAIRPRRIYRWVADADSRRAEELVESVSLVINLVIVYHDEDHELFFAARCVTQTSASRAHSAAGDAAPPHVNVWGFPGECIEFPHATRPNTVKSAKKLCAIGREQQLQIARDRVSELGLQAADIHRCLRRDVIVEKERGNSRSRRFQRHVYFFVRPMKTDHLVDMVGGRGFRFLRLARRLPAAGEIEYNDTDEESVAIDLFRRSDAARYSEHLAVPFPTQKIQEEGIVVLFDIEGFGKWIREDADPEMFSKIQRLLSEAYLQLSASFVKATGDGFLAFLRCPPSAAGAKRLILGRILHVHQTVLALRLGALKLGSRMGICTGVVDRGRIGHARESVDIAGHCVILAARLESALKGGEFGTGLHLVGCGQGLLRDVAGAEAMTRMPPIRTVVKETELTLEVWKYV